MIIPYDTINNIWIYILWFIYYIYYNYTFSLFHLKQAVTGYNILLCCTNENHLWERWELHTCKKNQLKSKTSRSMKFGGVTLVKLCMGFNGYRWVHTFTLAFCMRVLTVILVALLSALTHSTRSCWSLACRKYFLIPALMTAHRQRERD